MACPGGCVNGGGQPTLPDSIRNNVDVRSSRAKALYNIDENRAVRMSHENPAIKVIYDEFLGEVGGHKSHELLHTDHYSWKMPAEDYKAPSAPFKTTQ